MHSRLHLTTQLNRHGQTTFASCFYTPPLKILPLPQMISPVWSQALPAIQMSSSPGLLAGDSIDIDIELAEQTQLYLFTQAFTRVQSMPAATEAQQHTRIYLHEHSRLCYLPHPLVLHRDAALTQTMHITLSDNCQLILGEIIACGRVLNQESWDFRYLSSRINIDYRQQTLLNDNIYWHPHQQPLNVLGQMEQYTHQACLYYVNTAASKNEIQQLVNEIYSALQPDWPLENNQYLWGITQAADCALCIRALGLSAETLQQILEQTAYYLS
ncbi:urease accessory protein UreD [Snodgrassella sp. ESL0323]|uniref:urease accessory protein UreD n=1 Tax=Snodgrassella sp. ESL0323 TaxID=2705034 RepID=UPI001583CC75|nr:urease accessory protein UreD [Snodgrassella sp. ESL0323]NUF77775.1 urease accessory protein UreD [Snodgrassella sp. ESL0323]